MLVSGEERARSLQKVGSGWGEVWIGQRTLEQIVVDVAGRGAQPRAYQDVRAQTEEKARRGSSDRTGSHKAGKAADSSESQ